jgi:flagellar protein FliL
VSTSAPTKPVAAPAAAGPEAAGPEAAEPTPARPKVKVPVYALIGLVLLVVLGAGGWFLAARLSGPSAPAPAEPKHETAVKATLSLGSVVVNVGPPEGRRYLKVGVDLGVPAPKDTKEVEEHKAQILDLLISVFSTTPAETLGSEEGREGLKKTLLARIRGELGLEKVSRVYFTEFMVQ